jgi:hypothetical protein
MNGFAKVTSPPGEVVPPRFCANAREAKIIGTSKAAVMGNIRLIAHILLPAIH